MKDIVEKFWITEEGYPAVVRFNDIGYRVGYVGVSKEHKLFGKDCDGVRISAHGGLTYSNKQRSNEKVKSYPTKVKDYDGYWFFGFDCGHWGDAADVEAFVELHGEKPAPTLPYRDEGVIRTLEYCIEQCNNMSKQLKEQE